MDKTFWYKGEINPPESGEYYTVLEAQHDILDYKKGDIEITSDYYDATNGEWDTIGKDNPTWNLLAWADIPKPSIPENLIGRVKRCFGREVGEENG